jgi:hypothetical protein
MIFLYWSENIFKTSPQKFLNFIDNLSINNNNNTLSFLELLNILKIQKTLTLILTPFIAFFSIYLFSGVLYIMIKGLKLNQKQKANYDNTLQLVAFCQAPMIISFIPIIGPLISPIWCIMLLLRGITTLYFGNTIIKFIIILLPGLTIKFMWIYSLDIIASSI